jgi:hypothetical protein
VFALAMCGALARALMRRAPARATAQDPPPRRSEALVAALAALDARHEAGDDTLSAEQYASERASLKGALTVALAEDAPPT